jgi:hypothetical protein
MCTPNAGTATRNISTTLAMPVSTAAVRHAVRYAGIGSGVPRTRLSSPVSRAVVSPMMTLE